MTPTPPPTPDDYETANEQLVRGFQTTVDELLAVLQEGVRAIGEHSPPTDCYATGPITGNPVRDLVECPACSFLHRASPFLCANTRAALRPPEPSQDKPLDLAWHAGAPSKPWREEWFIAQTTYGDRVVLKALPEEYAYDFKTADETYIKADKIKRWMQFPDSEYIAPSPTPSPDDAAVLDRDTLGRIVREAWVRWALTQPNPKQSWLVSYDHLSEPDKEADRQIGEAVLSRMDRRAVIEACVVALKAKQKMLIDVGCDGPVVNAFSSAMGVIRALATKETGNG